jgi:hypothetical protein
VIHQHLFSEQGRRRLGSWRTSSGGVGNGLTAADGSILACHSTASWALRRRSALQLVGAQHMRVLVCCCCVSTARHVMQALAPRPVNRVTVSHEAVDPAALSSHHTPPPPV